MDHKQAAITILGAVGGVKNIISAQHCATRLRLVLRTAELANDNAIRAVPGVLDVVRADGQYQIVIGPDVVNVFSALLALPGFDAVAACDAETDAPDFSPSDTQEKRKVPLWSSAQRAFISTLAAIIVPVVPALTAAGSLRALLMLLNALGLTAAWRPYYQVLFGLCNMPFRFLPILFAYTAARRFHAEMGVSFMAACALVTPGLADAYMLGLPHGSTASKMISSVGSPQNILPVIVVVWFISVVGRQAEKYSPQTLKFFLVPLLTFLFGAIPALFVLAPAAGFVSAFLEELLLWLSTHAGWLFGLILGICNPLLVMSGKHYIFVALGIASLSHFGWDSLVGPGMMAANVAQGAAALAVALCAGGAWRKRSLRSGITALLGITEPAMFGCNLRLKYPMRAALIGGGAGGLFLGLKGVRRYVFGSPGLLILPGHLDPAMRNFTNACLGCLVSAIVTFAVTVVLHIQKSRTGGRFFRGKRMVYAPAQGQIVPLSKVPDSVFSQQMLGPGCAIDPVDDKLYAPFDCQVRSVAQDGHAIGLQAPDGTQVLIHVGINTVYLKECCFFPKVKIGEHIKKGDLLLSFDLERIRKNDCCTLISVVLPEYTGTPVVPPEHWPVAAGDPLFGL